VGGVTMKRIMLSILTLFLLYVFSCSSQLEQTESQDFVEPTLESKPRISFPRIAEEENYSGNVKVLLYVSETGIVNKVDILESSSYAVLDEAAVDYFKRFVFNPARGKGKPISSRVIWDINFNFVDKESNANDYVEDVMDLYNEVSVAAGEEKNEIQDKIFSLHNQFVNSMWNSANFNATITKVVSPNLTQEWSNVSKTYPLTFLLYHDFSLRFPDYHNSSEVNKELMNALKSDISYINQIPVRTNGTIEQKQELVKRIKKFIEMNYPEYLNSEREIDIQLNSKINLFI
jgi:TonB family protein